jgi:methyltransferase (TIGR00027 family)
MSAQPDRQPVGVSRTAVLTAALRAAEAQRPERLFDDPYAELFAAAAAGPNGSEGLPTGATEYLAVRTRYFDDQAQAGAAAGLRQVVLLAVGLDTRAFRLPWAPATRLFELDLPQTFAFKEPILAAQGATARCTPLTVPVDLREDWPRALAAAGFEAGTGTLWLAEGLLPYLSGAESDRLLDAVTDLSAPGSRFVFDYMGQAAMDRLAMKMTADTVRDLGAELLLATDLPEERLTGYGWQFSSSRIPPLAVAYGRPMPAGTDPTTSFAATLIAAVR